MNNPQSNQSENAEDTKRNAAIVALYEKTHLPPAQLTALKTEILYAWVLSLGRYYDKELKEWVVELYPY